MKNNWSEESTTTKQLFVCLFVCFVVVVAVVAVLREKKIKKKETIIYRVSRGRRVGGEKIKLKKTTTKKRNRIPNNNKN